jgi:hypothetical protein
MRANKWSSIASGVVFGLVARFAATGHIADMVPLVLFLVFAVTTVIGVPQLREVFALQARIGRWRLWGSPEYSRFCVSMWKHMFLFGVSCACAAVSLMLLGA